MTHIFTYDRQTVSPMRERRLMHVNIPDWHTDATLQNGVQERKDSLNPLGFDRMDPNIRGLDQMIQATQQEYELRQNMGEDTRRTQLYSIQKLWQDDYNMQVSDNFPSGNSPKTDKRSWLDASNAELASKGATYRLSIINDTVLPKPVPKVPKVTEAIPGAGTLDDDDGEKPGETPASTVDAAGPIRAEFDPKERLEITARAKDMLDAAGWKNLSAADRNALVNSIKMKTGASVDVTTDPEAPILSSPKDRYERYRNKMDGIRGSIDTSFTDAAGDAVPRPAPTEAPADREVRIRAIVDMNDSSADKAFVDELKDKTVEITKAIADKKVILADLRLQPTPDAAAIAAVEAEIASGEKSLAGYAEDAAVFAELLKGREEKKEDDDALATLDDDHRKIMEKALTGDMSEVNRLKELNVPLAKMLIRVNRYLPLNGIAELTPEVADILGGHSHYVMLDGLTKIDAPVARGLSSIRASLDLNGLTEIDEAVALELAKHSFWLELNGVVKMDDATAKALAQHKGDLNLGGLVSISNAGVTEIANAEGLLSLGIGPSLSLEDAKVLAKHTGRDLTLSNVRSLGTSEAQALGQRQGGLNLGLDTITPEVAAALTAVNTGYLSLYKLNSLTPEVAVKLAPHKGKLYLINIKSLDTVEVAKALADREEPLNLDGLETITREIATALFANHPQKISLYKLSAVTLAPEVIQVLVDNRDKIDGFDDQFRDKPEFKVAIEDKWSPDFKAIAFPDKKEGAIPADAAAMDISVDLMLTHIASIKQRADKVDVINGVDWHLENNPNIADGTPEGAKIRPKLEELKVKLTPM